MMFLEELVVERARQIQLREVLLLLVRGGIVACLSLALMRPIVRLARGGDAFTRARTPAQLF